jgi:RNA polymerase sigma-70 factor (ECF subfamily)
MPIVTAPSHLSDYAVGIVAAPESAAVPADGFRTVFERHCAYVWTTLRRLGVEERDVEDVTHDTFVRVAAHLHEYDPSRPIRAWLFVFALRMARDYRRLARRRHEVVGALDGDMTILDAPAADELVAARETHAFVCQALESLDWDKRAVFVACELEELPIAEVAESLGIPRNTAASRLRLARVEFTKAVRRLAKTRER